MNLYELAVDAATAVETYKHPNLDEWVDAIDPILKALDAPPVWGDQVDYIQVTKESVCIGISYTVRQCHQTDTRTIPLSVLKSSDPIKAANLYRVNKALTKARIGLEFAHKKVAIYAEDISKLELELIGLQGD